MSEKLKRCKACEETFTWNGDVILVNDEVYHKDCVSLYPTGYVAYINDEFLMKIRLLIVRGRLR